MKLYYYIFFGLTFLLNACTRYEGDFSKIEIDNFEEINNVNKIETSINVLHDNKSTSLKARIKSRGGSSIGYAKKNFTLSLNKEYKFKGLKKDDDWILNASVVDKTFLRNVLCYKLFREFGSYNEAPKTKYAEIYVKDEYYGFYVLCERLDISSLDLNRESALLYKEPAVFRPYQEKLDSISKIKGNYYHQKLPKTKDVSLAIDLLKDFILYASDSIFEDEVFDRINIKNIVDWHLLLMLSNNADGLQKNFILYKKSEKSKFRVAIWDCDHSFGRDGDNELNMLERNIDIKNNILIKRLMENPKLGYNKMLRKRWEKLRKSKKISKKAIKKFIDTEAEKIRPFVNRNFDKWPLVGWPYHDKNDFEAEIEIMKKFIDIRIPQLDSLYQYKKD